MSVRLLLIGLDAFEHTVLFEWARQGLLPTVARFLDTSAWGITEAPNGLYAGAVWPSISTGTGPARHRRYFRLQASGGDYVEAPFSPHEIVGSQFWETLSDAGHRVGVIDVPHSRPARSLNGIQVLDWATHEPELESPSISGLPAAELANLLDGEPRDLCEQMPSSAAGVRRLRDHLKARIHAKVELCRRHLESQDWDLFFPVFGEAHCAGHQWWHLHDDSHPAFDAALSADVGNPLRDIYIAVDRAVGEILEMCAATRTVVFASHGMGQLCPNSVVLDEVLRRLERGVLASAPSPFARLKRVWYGLPLAVRDSAALRALKQVAQPRLQRSLALPERRTRRYFPIPSNPHAGAIRINVRGRQSDGLVRPGAEYERLCSELREQLMELAYQREGGPAVECVYAAADLGDGSFAEELPDLLIEWRRTPMPDALVSPRIGRVAIPRLPGRSGDHTKSGVLFATGAGIRPGRLDATIPVADLAPTFCTMLDVAPPAQCEGHPVARLVAGADRGRQR